MALFSRADCICLWWWDRAAGCIWTPPHEGPFCPPCWRNPSTRSPLPHIPSTQRACCCEEHSSPGHGSPGVLCIAKLHHPLSGWWHSTAQLGWESEDRQRGLSPPSSLETLGNVSFPCGSKPLSSQSPRSWFRLLASFPAQQEVAFLSWWQLQMSWWQFQYTHRREGECPDLVDVVFVLWTLASSRRSSQLYLFGVF